MGLIKLHLTERNHEEIDRDYALNTEKIGNFFRDGDEMVFYYPELENRRVKAVRYKTNDYSNVANFKEGILTRAEAVWNNDYRVNLNVVAKGINEEPWEKDVNLNVNRILYVWNHRDETHGVVEFESGAYEKLRYKTEEKMDEIMEEISASGSVIP